MDKKKMYSIKVKDSCASFIESDIEKVKEFIEIESENEGAEIIITPIEMSQAEYDALPEFEGF